MGQCGEMEICKDRLLHLHRIKQKFTSVGSRSGAFMTASSSGARAALSLFFLGLSLNVSRVEGSWDFFPPSESGEAAGGSARGLPVWKSIPADCLLWVDCRPTVATPGPPDASSWGPINRPCCLAHHGASSAFPTQAAGVGCQTPQPNRTPPSPPVPATTNRFELACQGPERAHRCVLFCCVLFCVVLFNLS